MQSTLWACAASCLAIAGIAMVCDRRQQRRADLDRVGLASWPLILVIALLAAAVCAALALKSS